MFFQTRIGGNQMLYQQDTNTASPHITGNTVKTIVKTLLIRGFLPFIGLKLSAVFAVAAALTLSFSAISLALTPETNAELNLDTTVVLGLDWADDEPQTRLSTGGWVMIPIHRPDPSSILPLAPSGMTLPELRPDRRSLYSKTALTLDAFFLERFGQAPNQPAAQYKLKSGEGLATMLKRGGMTATDAQNALAIVTNHHSLRRLPIGFTVDIIPPLKNAIADVLPIGGLRMTLADDYDLTVYQNLDGNWLSQISTRPIERSLAFAEGTIASSLYKATKSAGISDNVFNTFVQVLSFSVDFQREIQKGDRFEALFEVKRDLITGKTRSDSELYYISMTLSGDRLEYFRHEHADGTIAWYDAAGNSASRTLMRTPVNGARLSSGFGKRKHPVLGYSKIHRGLDFAAPSGTPIMAAGAGVVEYAGWNGSYGRYIRIRHNTTYKTAYAHMSKVNGGISPGVRVKQGQIIGFVGSSGRSTGAHLHYEILVNNRKTNPMTVRLPAGKSIPELERTPFAITLAGIEEELISRGIVRVASE
ncbi:MAG: peptidoglycan DD-metalloendopeptidase family protein [Candidatus Puniceispirillales bacterium WSBS_2018_MAG_OTU23]